MIFDGQRQLMLSGAIHFARVMPQDWDRVLGQTYVMWNFHEHERGQISWSGRRNLTRFVELAGQHGLAGLLLVG
jgi:beta-galactosidase